MKSFFKFFTASCLGTIAALALIIIGFAIFGSISASSGNKLNSGVLLLDFKDFVPEKTGNIEDNPYQFEDVPTSVGLRHYKRLINDAKTNSKIKGIVIKGTFSEVGHAKSIEIQEALKEFRESSEKFVYAYADFYSQNNYLLATAADSIFLNPLGMVDMRGKATVVPFFKEAMDKLGVKFDIFYAGNFKSASEPYRRTEMSEANKLQTREFLGEMYQGYLDIIAAERSIDRSELHEIVDQFKLRTAEDAVDFKMVDQLVYWHEFEDMVREKIEFKKGRKINYIDIGEYATKVKLGDEGSGKDKIAIVYAEGNIQYNNEAKGQISEVVYHPIFDKIEKDDNIKAIVLRVNSPGGNAFSSEEILNELERIQEVKGIPVIASFGNYAASGGYYISATADTIVSEPHTLTGSIGVFSMIPNASKLLTEKLGIRFDSVKTAEFAVGPTPFFELSEGERSYFTNSTNRMYQIFLSRVAKGRDMTVDQVHEVAQGRVWTGNKAKELGLVDEIGDLDRAIEIAAESASLDKYKIVEYPKIKKSIWMELAQSIAQGSEVKMNPLDGIDISVLKHFKTIQKMAADPSPQARLPFVIEY